MRLPPEQIERFYAIWKPLILFVNRKLRVEPAMLDAKMDRSWDPSKVYTIREALWANDAVRAAFIAENPARLSAADLAVVEGWRYRVAGTFSVLRHLKKHSILIGGDPQEVYAVLGLGSTLDEVVPFTPCYVQAVLLPFEGRIIYDSLMVPYNIYLGPGIRRSLSDAYKDAKERGAIITSLLPREQPASREEGRAEARGVDARVLEAFRKHEYRTGRSPKVVERDMAAVAAFAGGLANRPQPRSLRDFGESEVGDYLTDLRSEGRGAKYKQDKIGLTRFLGFLRDTGRMDDDMARDVLGLLKGRSGQ